MQLVDVYKHPEAPRILFELLRERTPEQSISHKGMPTWDKHCLFISSHPYVAWYLITVDDVVGSVYLTLKDEIGIFIFNEYHSKGYGSQAIKLLMEKHPRDRYLANMNPENYKSSGMFMKLGFKHIQDTYVYES